jgi:release factor glutamine methyltransferase
MIERSMESEMMDYSETVPVQYQGGKARFMGTTLAVDKRVLIPRPETELLVSIARDLCCEKAWKTPFILDVGTGSGAISIGLAISIPGSRIMGSDVSAEALCVAKENVKRTECGERIELVRSDMFESFGEEYRGKFDVIVSNPPYVSARDYEGLDAWVKAEPKVALYAGEEGMDYLDLLAERSEKFLKQGGFLAVECGYDQAEKVKKKMRQCNFTGITSFKDFNGYERVTVGWMHG